jgi:Xaa-Pro aminopeptidase
VGPRAEAARLRADALRAVFGGRPLVLTTPGSVNWRSGGLSDPVDRTAGSDPVWTIDCDGRAALITSEVEAPRLEADFRVRELGWDVVSVPWYETGAYLKAACAYANVGPDDLLSDGDAFGADVGERLILARLELSEPERDELRGLGSLVGEALGAGMDAWRPGVSRDYDSAAAISATLESRGATAVCLIVGGDDRLRTLRHPLAVGAVVHDAIMAVVVARRAGLHAAATRICVRRADDQIVQLMAQLDAVNAALLDASRPGGTWGDALVALAAGYDRIGRPGAWREHYQGGPIGYEQREFELAPTHEASPFWAVPRAAHTAVAWNPSLRGGAKFEETYLVGEDLEWVTATPSWPVLEGPHGSSRSALRVLA